MAPPPPASDKRTAAKQRPNQIREAQEAAQKALTPGTLYIALYFHEDPPQAGDFYWSLYQRLTDNRGVTHELEDRDGLWSAKHVPEAGIFKRLFLCVLIEIGTISGADKQHLFDRIVNTYDRSLHELPCLDCDVWLMNVVILLDEAGLLECPDIGAFQQECLDLGNEYLESAAKNEQPRPLRVARMCKSPST